MLRKHGGGNLMVSVGGQHWRCLWVSATCFVALITGARAETVAPGAGADTRIADAFSTFAEGAIQYYSWRGTRGSNTFDPTPGKGSQVYAPVTLGFDWERPGALRLQSRVKSGYVHSNHATAGQEASIDTMVDTQMTTTLTYLGSESLRTFVGVALNLPTGKTYLPGNLRLTRMDPDLVAVGSYGAGFNVNPTGGIIFALTENTAVSLSGGYSWQGPFNRESIDPASTFCGIGCLPTPTFNASQRVDPGNIFTGNVDISSIFDRLAVKTSFAFMSETDLSVDGVTIGRKGAKLVANTSITYRFDPRWAVLINGSWSYTEKDKISDPFTGALVTEPKNSNSQVLIGSFEPVYALTEQMTIGVNYSFLWRIHNYYDFTENQFVPEKTKHSVGSSLTYAVTPKSSITLRGSYFWVNVADGPYLPTLFDMSVFPGIVNASDYQPPQQRYTGWTAMVSGKVQF